MSTGVIKIISLATTIIGTAASVAGSIIAKKEMDVKIAEQVGKAVSEALKKESN